MQNVIKLNGIISTFQVDLPVCAVSVRCLCMHLSVWNCFCRRLLFYPTVNLSADGLSVLSQTQFLFSSLFFQSFVGLFMLSYDRRRARYLNDINCIAALSDRLIPMQPYYSALLPQYCYQHSFFPAVGALRISTSVLSIPNCSPTVLSVPVFIMASNYKAVYLILTAWLDHDRGMARTA